jgi:hypothetical protein
VQANAMAVNKSELRRSGYSEDDIRVAEIVRQGEGTGRPAGTD